MLENLSPSVQVFLLAPLSPTAFRKRNCEKQTLLHSSLSSPTFLICSTSLASILPTPTYSTYISSDTFCLPLNWTGNPFSVLRRSRGTGRSSLCASPGGCPRACGLSCASAWLTGWGSTPGRWCIGRARHRCGCAGA